MLLFFYQIQIDTKFIKRSTVHRWLCVYSGIEMIHGVLDSHIFRYSLNSELETPVPITLLGSIFK